MAFLSSAIIASAVSLYSSKKQRDAQKEAQKQARIDANRAEAQARTAEVFAETEGAGLGNIGTVSLEVDDDIEEDEEIASNVSI